MKSRKRLVFTLIILAVLGLFALTNPNESDYYDFTVKEFGQPPHELMLFSRVERINFFLFSSYTPYFFIENGVTHLGIMGKFIRISDGQFDYPWWLEFFN
jgi:hypothetical protein